MPPVVVVGGGLAGIAAAMRLIDGGKNVVLLESRKKLGGRATSFVDPRTGDVLDNCQHVLMGSCTNLLDLYERLGVLANIEWHPRIWWANPPHEPDMMMPGRLPAPAHFTVSFLRMRFLDRSDKRGVARAMWRLIRMGRDGRELWRGRSFGAFLDEMQQTQRARELFWEPIVTSACNATCARTDAFHAMYVFQGGFLQDAWSPVMGLSSVPLWSLYDPAQTMLADAGGSLRTGISALALAFDGRRITGVVTDEGVIEASAVIAAVPPDRLSKLCSQVVRRADCRLAHLDEFEFSPILGAHLFFSQPVLSTPHLVLPGRATHWLFDKGRDAHGRFHVHAVVSAADEWMELDEGEIIDRLMRDIHWALPKTVGMHPEMTRTVKEKRATFLCRPGIDAIRPTACADGVRGGINNLFLAGDWCATEWPATMEGAVRSGYLAAQGVVAGRGVVADVPPARLARILGL